MALKGFRRFLSVLLLMIVSMGGFAHDVRSDELDFYIACLLNQCQPESVIDPETISNIKPFLHHHAQTLSKDAIDTVASVLTCAYHSNSLSNSILVVIDYSLPSNQKRLWVFDLKEKQLLFHTYVSHGINSGALNSDFFSNINNSKTSSIGVFKTGKSYNGRYGIALKLEGLEKNVNDNAMLRDLVMHSAWYVDQDFIRKYGRVGRSWGCPAIPLNLIEPVINTIRDQSLLVVYYPSDQWLSKSSFVTCHHSAHQKITPAQQSVSVSPEMNTRGAVLFLDKSRKKTVSEQDPVVVMSALNYQKIYKVQVPLERMLRRQVKNTEYIVMNLDELKKLDTNNDHIINDRDDDGIQVLEYFVPVVKKVNGFFATEFTSVNLQKPIEINLTQNTPVLITANSTVLLKSTDKFIRWIGL